MNEKKNQFIKVMREHSNEELQNILTRKRTDYVSDALEAAEEVLKERGVEVNLYNINEQISVNAERGGSTDADMYMRLFGYLIDLIVIIAIDFVIIFLHSIMTPLSDFYRNLYYWVVFVFYYISLEFVNNGKTIGKIVLKMRVVNSRGNELSISQICLRLVCRFIPFDAFSFLWEGNWHDKLSGTKVVKTTINSAITNRNDEQPKIDSDSVDFKCPVCGNTVEKYVKVCPCCHETIWQREGVKFSDLSTNISIIQKTVMHTLPQTSNLEEDINSRKNDNRSKIIFPRISGKVITTIFIVLFIVMGLVSLFWNRQGKSINNDTSALEFVSEESSIVENDGNQTTMRYVDIVRQNIVNTEYPVQIADSVVLVGQCVDGDTVVNTIQYVGLVGPLNIEELRMGLISDLKSLDNEELQIIQEEGVFLKYEFVNENGKGIGNIVISPNLLK